MIIDHVALVVGDIERVVTAWSLPRTNAIEEFPGEGTRELYIGSGDMSSRMLLMQPIGPGPYDRAYKKRGPGLHHLSFRVPDGKKFLTAAKNAGWEQPPSSLDLWDQIRQIWLCKPKMVPTLIEINEGPREYADVGIDRVQLPLGDDGMSLFRLFETDAVAKAADGNIILGMQSKSLDLTSLPLFDRLAIVEYDEHRHAKHIGAITKMLHAAYKPLADRGMRYVASHQDENMTRKRLTSEHSYLGMLDGEVVATITLTEEDPDEPSSWYQRPEVFFFQQFAVKPSLQSIGLGKIVMAHVEQEALRLGAKELALDTSEHADNLIGFYTAKGYRIVERANWSMTNYESVVLSKALSTSF